VDRRLKWAVYAAVVLILLVPVVMVAIILVPPPFLVQHTHTYDYQTRITVNDTVEDATFYLPVPAEDGEVTLSVEDIWIYDEDGDQMTGEWETSIVETPNGPMLRVRADRIPGETRYTVYRYAPNGSFVSREEVGPGEVPENATNTVVEPNPTTYSISARIRSDDRIDTRTPLGNASFLSPAFDVTPAPCEYSWDDDERCYDFATRAYADYASDGSVRVGLGGVEFTGANEWGFALYNSFNLFEASTERATYVDGATGWRTTDGSLLTGRGTYPEPPGGQTLSIGPVRSTPGVV
jgi:hypothetical protein